MIQSKSIKNKRKSIAVVVILILFSLFILKNSIRTQAAVENNLSKISPLITKSTQKTSLSVITPSPNLFTDNFSKNYSIEENGGMSASKDPNWWLNSGGRVIFSNGIANTIQGDLPANDPQRIKYVKQNPSETDNGLHPQNIFRLVTKSKWKNLNQQVYFKLNKYYTSDSQNRQGSNGFFLFNRYQSADTLYYTGLRVDGTASIKKKYNGTYYDMTNVKFIKTGKYDRSTNPNLLPVNQWVGLKSVVSTQGGITTVSLYVDLNRTGNWVLAAQAIDNGTKYGTPEITDPGYGGIRTDFMDASFSNYSISEK